MRKGDYLQIYIINMGNMMLHVAKRYFPKDMYAAEDVVRKCVDTCSMIISENSSCTE